MKKWSLLYPCVLSGLFRGIIAGMVMCAGIATVSAETTGMNIGDTRLVYNAGSKSVSTDAINGNKFPYLVQSWVEDMQGQRSSAFIVTPPLFRLEAEHSTRLRITRTGTLPEDRETVSWLVVRFIPSTPTVKDDAGNSLKLSTRIRVKLFYRPSGLPGSPEKTAESLQWSRQAASLVLTNPNAYSVSLAGLRVNGLDVKGSGVTVPAYTSRRFSLKNGIGGVKLVFGVIDDYGAVKSFTRSLP